MNTEKTNSSTPELPSVARSLPIALLRAREKVMAPFREMLSRTDITEQQWRVLRILSECGPQDSTHLAQKACLLSPSLTRISQSMLEKGYISRTANTHDRRRLTLAITAKGQQLIQANIERAAEISASFKQALGEEKYEHLIDLLTELEALDDPSKS